MSKFIDLLEQMRVRHSNMLAMAHFLKTTTEPPLVCPSFKSILSVICTDRAQYYKPWKCQAKEQETIKRQIDDAKAVIEKEKEEFAERHPQKVVGGNLKPNEQNDIEPKGEQANLVSNEASKATKTGEEYPDNPGRGETDAGTRNDCPTDTNNEQQQTEMTESEPNQVEHPVKPSEKSLEGVKPSAELVAKKTRDSSGETSATKDSDEREKRRASEKPEDEVMEEHGEDTVIY